MQSFIRDSLGTSHQLSYIFLLTLVRARCVSRLASWRTHYSISLPSVRRLAIGVVTQTVPRTAASIALRADGTWTATTFLPLRMEVAARKRLMDHAGRTPQSFDHGEHSEHMPLSRGGRAVPRRSRQAGASNGYACSDGDVYSKVAAKASSQTVFIAHQANVTRSRRWALVSDLPSLAPSLRARVDTMHKKLNLDKWPAMES